MDRFSSVIFPAGRAGGIVPWINGCAVPVDVAVIAGIVVVPLETITMPTYVTAVGGMAAVVTVAVAAAVVAEAGICVADGAVVSVGTETVAVFVGVFTIGVPLGITVSVGGTSVGVKRSSGAWSARAVAVNSRSRTVISGDTSVGLG